MYPRSLPLLAVLAVFALAGAARAQTADAIDALLDVAPDVQASREVRADALPESVGSESLLDTPAPLNRLAPGGLAPGGLAPGERPLAGFASPDAICRMMTDMAQRSRRERVCMPRAGWEALIRVAKGPGFRTSSAGRLKVAYRGRRD